MAKIHIGKQELEKALKIVGTSVIPNRAMPIFEYIRITTKDNRIKLEAANSGGGLKTYTDVDMSSEDISFCVHYKDLLRYVGAIDDHVTIEVSPTDKLIKIQHSSGDIALPFIDGKDFPDIETNASDDCTEFTIPGKTLAAWLQKAKAFPASDPLRPHLSGVCLKGSGTMLAVAASDQKLLYLDSMKINSIETPFAAIIPPTAVATIISIAEQESLIKIFTNSKKIWLKCGDTTLTAVLLEGKYPNVESIIPASYMHEVTIPKTRLIDAMKRIGLAIGTSSHVIKLTFSEYGTLELSHENTAENKSASESVTYGGALDYTIRFTYDSLNRVISAIDGEDIVMRFNEPHRAAALKESEGSPEKTVLIMPTVMATPKANH